ncbi:MAG: ATP-binding protein [Acidovorax sp.]
MKTYSLARRLTATTVGGSVLVGLVSTAIVLFIAWKEVSDAFDDTLKEGAQIALALGEGAAMGKVDTEHGPRMKLNYQIIARDGTVALRGKDAPRQPFVDPGGKSGRFHDVYVHGDWWRVYLRRNEAQGISVQIGQKWDKRSELVFDALESLAWPLAALWALLALANWWLVRRLVRPLTHMAESLAAQSPTDLTPVAGDQPAHEIRAVTTALNRLLTRLAQALEGERRFTADAAHELRTPLAALASRLQVLQRSHPALAAELQPLRDDVARNTALVENLLQLARLDPESADAVAMGSASDVDLPALFDDAVRTCTPAAAARHIHLATDCQVPALPGHRDWLFSALRNLIDNAIRYGREGGQVRIEAARRHGAIEIAVRDDGPGVSDADRERLTQRFFRVLGTGRQGSGLGLSIVARVAQLHGATLSFGPGIEGAGLSVVLRFASSSPGPIQAR